MGEAKWPERAVAAARRAFTALAFDVRSSKSSVNNLSV